MNFKDIVSKSLPFVGGLIGGPLGGQAGSFLSKLLTGKEGSSEEEITNSLLSMAPDKLIELKKIDAQYQEKLLSFEVDQQNIAYNDRDSARKSSVEMVKNLSQNSTVIEMLLSRMPAVLATILTCGFFLVLFIFMIYPVQTAAKDVLEVLIGSLGTAWIQSMAFFFGTTHSSQSKTKIIADAIK